MMNIKFSANIRIVSRKQFWKRLPGAKPEKNNRSSYPYMLESSRDFGRKKTVNNRYTDPAFDCCIFSVGNPKSGKLFHLQPFTSNINALPWQLPNILKSYKGGEATIIGGIPFYEESTELKNSIEMVLKSENFKIRKLWGKYLNISSNFYISKNGTIWISLQESRLNKRRPKSITPKNTLNWLHDAFREIVLLPEDKLFIGNSEKPLLEGPYSCGRVAF